MRLRSPRPDNDERRGQFGGRRCMAAAADFLVACYTRRTAAAVLTILRVRTTKIRELRITPERHLMAFTVTVYCVCVCVRAACNYARSLNQWLKLICTKLSTWFNLKSRRSNATSSRDYSVRPTVCTVCACSMHMHEVQISG